MHKLMPHRDFLWSQAMIERDSDQALGGIVQMDDAYWGGERHGGGVGRGSPGKTPFVAAVQCTPEGHPIAMRMDVVSAFRKTVLAAWAQRHRVPGTAVVSDGLTCFPGVTDDDCTHVAIPTGGGVPDLGHPIFGWVNTMLGNVKNAMHGTYHAAPKVPAALSFRVLLSVQSSLRLGHPRTAAHRRCSEDAAAQLSTRNLGCVIWGIRSNKANRVTKNINANATSSRSSTVPLLSASRSAQHQPLHKTDAHSVCFLKGVGIAVRLFLPLRRRIMAAARSG